MYTRLSCFFVSHVSVIRASVPKLNLDDAFEQKNDIAKAVEDELEKVI